MICIYEKESPDYLSKCLDSILAQTVVPDELVIVKDGSLTEGLERVLGEFSFPNDLEIVALPENVTLGPARAEGLKAARNEWVAIMDSDDICCPDRFEKQLDMISCSPELGLIGGQISEFDNTSGNGGARREVPLRHDDIVNFAKSRNPFNHMTVMLSRTQAFAAGNYRYFPLFEDYDLWTRMIKSGVKCANHPDVLVDVRAGSSMYNRRRGMSYIRHEWEMQKQLLRIGFITPARFAANTAIRMPVRLLPKRLLAAFYNKLTRK